MLEVRQREDAVNVVRWSARFYAATCGAIRLPVNRHQVIGSVSVAPLDDIPPAEQVVEARIGARLDIAVPEFPIRITGVFDLTGSQCLVAGLIAQAAR